MGLPERPVPMEFVQTHKMSDAVLMVEGQKLYVNKTYLSNLSPFFKAMFEKHIDDPTTIEMELNGTQEIELKYNQVLDFMKATHPPWQAEGLHTSNIKAPTIEYLLPLSRYFGMENLVYFRVDKLLAMIDKDHNQVSLTDKMSMVEKYGDKLPMTKELVFPAPAKSATSAEKLWTADSYIERHWRKAREEWLTPCLA